MKLHDKIKHLYHKIVKMLIPVEVLSKNGEWKKVESLNIAECSQFIVVKTKSHSLVCTPDHIVIDENDEEILAEDSLGHKVQTTSGIEEVIEVNRSQLYGKTYDLTLDPDSENDEDHLYYADGILSHNCVILDEFAFLQKNIADKLFTSMYPVISSSKSGKFIIVSTPNGTDNLYYDIWCQANSKEVGGNLDGWKPFEMHWWQVPGHDEAWKQKQIAAIGALRFAQEFDNQFLAKAGSKKLLPDEVIERLRMKLTEYKASGVEPMTQKIVSQNEDAVFEFQMWHEFNPNHTYLASADIAEGIGGDSSVLYVWDITTTSNIIMCAKFSSNTVSLVQFAYVVSKILRLYGCPWLAAERNGVSAGMLDALRVTYEYPNIIVDNKKGQPGIYSHVQMKCKACLWAKDMMTTPGFGFTIYDKDLVDELNYFVKKDTKGVQTIYHAMPGPNSHDDHVMALIWALLMLDNDHVQQHFIVMDTFSTDLGQVYANHILPLNAYTQEQMTQVINDPLYKQFIEFKNEAAARSSKLEAMHNAEDASDVFQYNSPKKDVYFDEYDEYDIGGGSWNRTPIDWNMKPGFQQGSKVILQSTAGGVRAPAFFVI